MAISFIDGTSNQEATNDDVVVTAPSGIQDNDLLLGWYTAYGDATTTALPISLSGSAGSFTQLTEKFEQSGTDVSMGVFYRVASSETGNYTFTGSHSGAPPTSAHILVFRGVDTGDPFDVTFVEGTHYVRNNNFAETAPTDETLPNPIDTESNGAQVVIFTWAGFGSVTDFTQPTGYTEFTSEVSLDNANSHTCGILTGAFGTETPDEILVTNAQTGADASHYTLALKEADTGTTIEIPTGPWR